MNKQKSVHYSILGFENTKTKILFSSILNVRAMGRASVFHSQEIKKNKKCILQGAFFQFR